MTTAVCIVLPLTTMLREPRRLCVFVSKRMVAEGEPRTKLAAVSPSSSAQCIHSLVDDGWLDFLMVSVCHRRNEANPSTFGCWPWPSLTRIESQCSGIPCLVQQKERVWGPYEEEGALACPNFMKRCPRFPSIDGFILINPNTGHHDEWWIDWDGDGWVGFVACQGLKRKSEKKGTERLEGRKLRTQTAVSFHLERPTCWVQGRRKELWTGGRRIPSFSNGGSIGGAGRQGRGYGKTPVRGFPDPAGAVRLAENGRRGNSNLPSGGPKPWPVEAIESRVHDHTQSKACRGRYLTWRGRITSSCRVLSKVQT